VNEHREELMNAVEQIEETLSEVKELLRATENKYQSSQRTSDPLPFNELVRETAHSCSKYEIPFTVGRNAKDERLTLDVTELPHLIVGGTTGSGKTTCLKNLLLNQLLFKSPREVKVTIIDPKRVEYLDFRGLPHLRCPVRSEMDEIVSELRSLRETGENRLEAMEKASAKRFRDYRQASDRKDETGGDQEMEKPYNLVILDGLEMLTQDAKQEIQGQLVWLSRLGKTAGIHLALSTCDPSSEAVLGGLKSNIPARIALTVTSGVDSRLMLGQNGARDLNGNGDMLLALPDKRDPIRLQAPFIKQESLDAICGYWEDQRGESDMDTEWSLPDVSEVLFAAHEEAKR
jgi:S-DNA-T family DNA segregation ATPase FtsK/SpoIIIE